MCSCKGLAFSLLITLLVLVSIKIYVYCQKECNQCKQDEQIALKIVERVLCAFALLLIVGLLISTFVCPCHIRNC